jgi:hypothetical protein
MKSILILFALALLTACAAPKIQTPLDINKASKIELQGTNTIRGYGKYASNITCAGGLVGIFVATAYADELVMSLFGNTTKGSYNENINNHDSVASADFQKYRRSTVCDSEGFFTFSNLVDETYYVVTRIHWASGLWTPQGSALMQKVTIQGGKTVEITLTP